MILHDLFLALSILLYSSSSKWPIGLFSSFIFFSLTFSSVSFLILFTRENNEKNIVQIRRVMCRFSRELCIVCLMCLVQTLSDERKKEKSYVRRWYFSFASAADAAEKFPTKTLSLSYLRLFLVTFMVHFFMNCTEQTCGDGVKK